MSKHDRLRRRQARIDSAAVRSRVISTRAGRRRIVLVGCAVLALLWIGQGVIIALAPSDLARNIYVVMLVLVVLIGFAVIGWLVAATRGALDLPEHVLDERQRGERHRALATSHRMTSFLLFAGYLAALLWVLSVEGDMVPVPAALLATMPMTIAATHWSVPTLIAAWRIPDPTPDDENDENDDS
ncbi:hypothetical protein [Sinosporangium siamense]|uniref:DUF2178 domain-containing protein n=1 Tax=Sinosporangium siamense TaxID=1367973 RepID=A0A919RI38_9ACTN|nr:hypothetical protein [Sinosporangium siamense]GII92381.1 hypothetical protein Ssi02_26120 [Sinosporangium siamense]